MATMPDPNYRYAMAKYPTDGVETDWQIAFDGGYISQADVYAYSYLTADRSDRTAHSLTFISESPTEATVRITPAAAAGRTLFIVRLTQRGDPLVDFINRSMLTEGNLNTITEQAIFSVAELEDAFRELESTVAQDAANALAIAQEALEEAEAATVTANSAVATANAADNKADLAVAGIASATAAANAATAAANDATIAANTATALVGSIQGEVDAAVVTANNASAIAIDAAAAANAISDLAEEANENAADAVAAVAGAVATANDALAVASGVDAKATTALSDSAAALASANDAVKKTPTGTQTMQGNLEAVGFVASRNAVAVRADKPGSAFNSYRYYWTNTAGDVNYGGIRTGRDGVGPAFVALQNETAVANVAIYDTGVVDINATLFQVRCTQSIFTGSSGAFAVMHRHGWSNGARRTEHVLESDGSWSLYGFNTSGGSGTRLYNIVSPVLNGSSAPELIMTGSIRTNGGQSAFWLQDRSNTSATRDWACYVDTAKFRIYNSTAGDRVSIDLTGGSAVFSGLQVVASGGFDTSSYKKKFGLKPLRYGLEQIKQIVTREGFYKEAPNQKRLFVVAEQLRNVIPEAVVEFEINGERTLAASYTGLVPVLIEALKQIDERLSALEDLA